MGRRSKYPAEVRERAVRLVFEQQGAHESQYAAIVSVATKLGCTPETLRKWVRQHERDAGARTCKLGTAAGRPGLGRRHCAAAPGGLKRGRPLRATRSGKVWHSRAG